MTTIRKLKLEEEGLCGFQGPPLHKEGGLQGPTLFEIVKELVESNKKLQKDVA